MEQVSHKVSAAESSSSRPKRDISWSNLNFNVGKKKILTNCWGHVPAGKVCAILGPSGAGKSSLLNVLAGRSSTSKTTIIEGKVQVGGIEINPVLFRKNIAYVMQDDALMATATPREALTFSATLRLPPTTTAAEITKLVNNLLVNLGIDSCADVTIGGALIKGISGGQRKRTSVGVEVITDPALLFLDEPTSGLDSHSACNLITLLKDIAVTKNSAILCTIHQPSSEVFELFDIAIYMKDGRIFYQGEASRVTSYYKDRNHPCPLNYNPSDFVMNLCQSVEGEELEDLFMPLPDDCVAALSSSKRQEQAMLVFQVQSPFFKQMRYLAYRELCGTMRDSTALTVRFGVTIVLNLIYGLIFLGAGGKDNGNTNNFSGHVGALTIVFIASMFGSAQPIMLSFPFERPMFLREYSTGTYTTTAYLLSKMLVEVPLTLVQIFVQYILAYFMIDMQGNFFAMVGAAFQLAMVSNSIAMAMGAAFSDVKEVTELSSLIFMPQILFAGFFVRTSQIPIFLRWAKYLCGMGYAMNLAYGIEFNLALGSCQEEDARDNCRSLLHSNNIHMNQVYFPIILLFVLFLAFRLLAAFILVEKAKTFY